MLQNGVTEDGVFVLFHKPLKTWAISSLMRRPKRGLSLSLIANNRNTGLFGYWITFGRDGQ